MYNLKKTLFLDLTHRQKSALLSYLQSFVKKNCGENRAASKYEILDKFLEEEQYYFKIGQTHFHFVVENLENEAFLAEILKFIEAVLYHLEMLEKQKPYADKQKEFAKQARKKAQDFKMSKELPTKKQLKYYEKLTKAHNLAPKCTEGASRLNLRDWILEIIDSADKGASADAKEVNCAE